jgi:phosphoglycolate phosphatase
VPPIKTVLFDLDGTLTDSAEGITRCLRHALERMDYPCPPDETLAAHIGPPLRQTFAALFDSPDEALIERAVTIYRERFATVGLYENRVYLGVPEMLTELRSSACDLFIATSKVSVYARRILEHFALDGHFVAIHGSEMNGRLDDKAHLLDELIRQHRLDPAATIMVGDRRQDIIAAKANGVQSVGVTYGYGSRGELETAGADGICDTPAQIIAAVRAF